MMNMNVLTHIRAIRNITETEKSQKIPYFELLYVLVLVIYAGNANTFVRSFQSADNLFATVLPVLLSGVMIYKFPIVFTKQFFALFFGLFLYFIAISIKFHEVFPLFMAYLVFCFFISYVTIKTLKYEFFRIYERWLYYLAIVSLGMWGIQIALGGDTLYAMVSGISNIINFSYVSQGGLNIVFYSLQPINVSLLHGYPIVRNCGFAWEPGGFASFLCLALFVNLFINKSEKNSTLRFWILFIALLSTQSTTGFIIFFIIIIFYFLQKNFQIIILLFPVFIVSSVILFSLPFMSDKITSLIDEAEYSDLMVEQSIGRDYQMTPQRFSSFMIAFKDFQQNPIFGYGGSVESRWYNRIGANISPISGIGNLLAQYGIIGFSFFISMLILSSINLARTFRYNGKFLLFLIIFLISVSYNIIAIIAMCFWMFSYFETNQITDRTI